MLLLHIVETDAWEKAKSARVYSPPSLATEGFIHLSRREQILAVATRFYRGQSGLMLLAIDSELLTAPVQWDEVPGHGTFPHLYGPLNLDAVQQALPFEPGQDGSFALPEGLPLAT